MELLPSEEEGSQFLSILFLANQVIESRGWMEEHYLVTLQQFMETGFRDDEH